MLLPHAEIFSITVLVIDNLYEYLPHKITTLHRQFWLLDLSVTPTVAWSNYFMLQQLTCNYINVQFV